MIQVEVSHSDLEYVRKRLRGHEKEAPRALRDAVNNTATHARKMLVEAAQDRYTVKKGGFYSHTKIRKATLSRPTAIIQADGSPLTQPRFHTTAPKSGAKTEVVQGSGMKLLVNAAGNRAFKAKGLIFQRKGKARTPLRAAYGPSVPKMLEKVYDGRGATAGLKAEIERDYQKNVRKQIERFLRA